VIDKLYNFKNFFYTSKSLLIFMILPLVFHLFAFISLLISIFCKMLELHLIPGIMVFPNNWHYFRGRGWTKLAIWLLIRNHQFC